MTTTKPADARAQAQPGRGGGQRRRRPDDRAGRARASRSEPVSLDPDAPTGPFSAVLVLLLGALELLGWLFSWTGHGDS